MWLVICRTDMVVPPVWGCPLEKHRPYQPAAPALLDGDPGPGGTGRERGAEAVASRPPAKCRSCEHSRGSVSTLISGLPKVAR